MSVSQVDPGGDAGRVRCLYCGANNFPAALACWQCSRPLKAVRPTPVDASGVSPAPSHGSQAFGGSQGFASPARPMIAETPLAPKAAAALGLLFPYVGLPAGMIFLMLDDPRKTQLGWIMIGWSLAGTVLNALFLAATLGPLWVVLKGMLPHPGGSSPAVPGLPTDGSEGIVLWFLSLLQV